jgi:hypothetical protein
MTESDLPYNRSFADLESLLSHVERPGDFCMHAALALPMPLVQVDGVGSLSFPLLETQAAALIAAAELAPYGRGEQTVFDTSVRRVWQTDAARVRLGGKHWASSLRQVLAEVARGLGCEGADIRADLYKLLDMGHVTERTGSPQTLVCRKTRAGYGRQCRQHAEDVAAMRALQALGRSVLEAECARLDAAAARQPKAAED